MGIKVFCQGKSEMSTNVKETRTKKIGRIASWAVSAVIALFILGILFVKLVPGFGLYIVRSGSMSPVFNAGDIIITGPVHQVVPGQIITFLKDGQVVTHRAVSVENGQITTKGDANNNIDTGTIEAASVQGSYLFKVPAIGYITNLTHSKQGWFLIVIVPALILVLFLVKDIIKEAFKDDKKKVGLPTGTATENQGGLNKEPVKPVKIEPPAPAVKAAAYSQAVRTENTVKAEVKDKEEPKKAVSAQVFSNTEVNENIKSELKKILNNLS